MTQDLFFRLFVAVALVYGFTMTSVFRARATKADVKSQKKVEGSRILTFFRLVFLLGLLALFGTYIFMPKTNAWAFISLPSWLRWVGVAIGIGVFPLEYWVLSSLGKNISPSAFARKEAHLVTKGPYRFIRHPLYFTGFMGFGSLFLVSQLWILGFLVACVLPVFLMIRIPREEKELAKKFGASYEAYIKKTKRLIPFIW